MFLVVILFLFGGFLFEEMTTTISLIIPMFAAYTTAILKYAIKNKEQINVKSKELNKVFVFISYSIPSLFIVFMVSLIILKACNIGFSSFEKFKLTLVSSETMFGAYIGFIISSLFETEKEDKNDKNDTIQVPETKNS